LGQKLCREHEAETPECKQMTAEPIGKVPRSTFHGAFTDPIAMARALSGLDSDVSGPHPIGAGKGFQASFTRAALDPLNIGVGQFSSGIPQSAGIPNLHVFMFPTRPSLVRKISGQQLFGPQIFHCRPNEVTVTSSPGQQPWAFGIITIPFEVLARHTRELTGRDHAVPLNDDQMFRVPETTFSRLVILVRHLERLVRRQSCIIEAPRPARALSGAIIDALIACLTLSQATPDRAVLGRHRKILDRFLRAVEERPEDMLSLNGICAEVGVAQRTLNMICQDFLSQAPIQYARARRLDRVRERLLASAPHETSVTDVAMQYGFWELGRFAHAYRQRFGERPSESLARPR
jgi:AraC-like DNA-binding protein